MRTDFEQLYSERLNRYVTAMRNGMPDRVPLRPFAAEITARHAGFTCQEVTHDYNKAFEAVIRCCKDYNWDAVVPNMVYVWTGLTQAIGLRYYGVPGIDVGPDVGFQYREPSEREAFMKREEYDDLIEDPTRFLYETWLPRVTGEVSAKGTPVTYRNNLSFVKGGMSMLSYFAAFGPQVERMRRETGTVSSICGMLKAPLDILADKLRGYIGLAFDLKEIPEKVVAACHALMPHLGYLALSSADPGKSVPIPIWMHRGCVPFISREHFETIYWPTLKPIVEALWAQGNQVLFYAEGKWDAHLERFAELPAGSIIFHIDRGDPDRVHRVLGRKFCLSGGVPNALLTLGKPEQVKAQCRKLIETIGAEGGYIMDASAIMQNDATLENLKAMTDATLEYGCYRSPSSPSTKARVEPRWEAPTPGIPGWVTAPPVRPGVCLPWEEKLKELPPMCGDPSLVRSVWESNEGFAYLYIWHLLLSF
ncbi:MAG TPA: uroporphyrinogen decarboxylase family protein [Bryobacteraceae bacterium]|nr:uroporphyrinogen decarboxylase family protein [Bryobacteraceae bacterium]